MVSRTAEQDALLLLEGELQAMFLLPCSPSRIPVPTGPLAPSRATWFQMDPEN